MKDLTHYFADSFKTAETHPVQSKEVILNSAKVSENSPKNDSAPKKRGRKKKKSSSPNLNESKRNKCELDIEKIKHIPKSLEDDLVKDSVVKDTLEKDIPKVSKDSIISEESGNKSSDNSDEKKVDTTELQNGQELENLSDETQEIVEVADKKENSVPNEKPVEENDKESNDIVIEECESPIREKKKKRKEKVKALAEKKGYGKRKQLEDKESEEMEKSLLARKHAFTNVPKRDENQPEIIPKPPAYSLLNYFSKATPEQKLKEEAAKCKISVKAEVHTPEESDIKNVTHKSTQNVTPKSRPKNTQSKKKKAEIKQALSQMDEIQLIGSESLSPPPSESQERKKANKAKWRIQFQSDNFTDSKKDSEISSPKRTTKTKSESKKSEETSKPAVLKAIENENNSENSEVDNSQSNHTIRSSRLRARKKMKEMSEMDESVDSEEEKNVSTNKTKSTDSNKKKPIKTIDNESSDVDITVVKEIVPKRSAPEKLAPLFLKKRKLDPAVLEARRMFLQSDMPENDNRTIKRKPSPVRNPVLPFPEISHITQLEPEANPEKLEIKLELKSNCQYSPSLDVSKFNTVTRTKQTVAQRSIMTFDSTKTDLDEALGEIESRCSDARTMWKNISGTAKGENPKKSPKVRTSKRRSSGKKVVNTEEEKPVDNVWICKYKPRKIEEIVGNEQAATKLKTWLEKWKIPSTSNNTDSDDDFYSSDCSSTYSNSDNNQVAVLFGPCGCGKTASVYAVAEELGYSVLEINASSKRAGKKILKELEEATKSHRIKKSDMQQTFLKTKVEEKKIPQNSLILIEDVDIIFEEDEGFISAAYQLASNTKRPIVMTCSEMCSYLNKMAPQQIHIQFQVTLGDRVSALLELISLAETGRKLSLRCVENLLEKGDLRKALLQLQYLLSTGDSHILPPVVAAHNRNGISLWQKVPHCLYKSAVKDGKKRKKISPSEDPKNDVDVLKKIADNLESVSLISKLIDLEDVSLSSQKSKSLMSLSLTEDMRSYSFTDSVSSSIADYLTFEIIQKKENTEQSSAKALSSLLKRRKTNTGINSVLMKVASTNDQRILSLDYLPSVRTICRAEEIRNSLNNKRGNRFFHYLHGTKIPSNVTNVLTAACKILQEKSE